MLGGITLLKVSGLAAEKPLVDEPLYQPFPAVSNVAKRSVTLTFIPYYAVGNRETSAMEVWVPVTRSESSKPETSALISAPLALAGTAPTGRHLDSNRKTTVSAP
jgi:hypothetical protein